MHEPDVLGNEIGLEQWKGCRSAGAELVWETLGKGWESWGRGGGAAITIIRDRHVKSEQTSLLQSNMLFQD